jgi:hypothetical protein
MRSINGTLDSVACLRTRSLKANQEISRLMNSVFAFLLFIMGAMLQIELSKVIALLGRYEINERRNRKPNVYLRIHAKLFIV